MNRKSICFNSSSIVRLISFIPLLMLFATLARSGQASATVSNIYIRPGNVGVRPGATWHFQVKARYSDSTEQLVNATSVVWSLSSASAGTIGTDGTYVAGQTAGTYTLQANALGKVAWAEVTIAPVVPSGGYALLSWLGGATPGALNTPFAVAVDSAGNAYVADSLNNRIQKFDQAGNLLLRWGARGTADGQFMYPRGIAVDSAGNVYVSDTGNNRIQKFTAAGVFLYKWGSKGTVNGQFDTPYGIATDSTGNVYVADYLNNRIQKFTSSGVFLTKWGSYGAGSTQFRFPEDVAVSANGVYVTDGDGWAVKEFSPTGVAIRSWPVSGAQGIDVDKAGCVYVASDDSGTVKQFDSAGGLLKTLQYSFGQVAGVAVCSDGTLLITEPYKDCVDVFDAAGTWLRTWGAQGEGQFNQPEGVALDSVGNLYVADTSNDRIQVFDPAGTFLRAWGSGYGGGQFYGPPSEIAVDPAGKVYVADGNFNDVYCFDLNGSFIRQWGGSGSDAGLFSNINGIAVNSYGQVFVADTWNYRIQMFDPHNINLALGWGSSGSNNGQFSELMGVAAGPGDAVYALDSLQCRVQKFNSTGTFLTSWGSQGSGNGQFGLDGYDGAVGVASDSVGNVYVADTLNDRLQKFSSSGSFITKWGEPGSGPGQLKSPAGLAVDGQGYVYVADSGNNRVVKLEPWTGGPKISISAPSPAQTTLGPVSYTVTYTGAAAVSLTAANVTLNKTGTANAVIAVSGSGTAARTVTISGTTGVGTLGISISAGSASNAQGSASAAGPSATFTVVPGVPPTITSFTPASGVAGTSVTITGTNFTGATAVKFNGVAATSFAVKSATSIAAVVPVSTTGKISVTTSGGTAVSGATFTVVPSPMPTVTSFSPLIGGVGTAVTIAGTNFTGATAVKFKDVAATSFAVNSTTSITAVVPNTTTGKVSVTTPGGTATAGVVFTFVVAPTITSFTPTSGGAGTSVTITGTNLAGATSVKFNGVAAASFAVKSATSITAVMPKTTTGKISVTTPGGTATSTASVTFIPAPTITSFTPTSGGAGATVTITGTNFTGATAVLFNGVAAAGLAVNSATSITAVVNKTTSGKISVTTPGGTASSTASFTFIPAPTIASFTPTSGVAGTTITITGTNLTGAVAVKVNGVAVTSFVVNSPTSISAVVPKTTFGKVSVTTLGGTATSSSMFTVTPSPMPTVSSVSPLSGGVGTTVTISGTGFTGATAVKFNNVLATSFTIASSVCIRAVVPKTTTGKISVTTPGGTASSTSMFTIVASPTITYFSPGSAKVGASVTITGTNFTGATSVKFNGVASTMYMVKSAGSITAVVPKTTSGKITVTTPGGTAISAGSFSVLAGSIGF